MNIPECDILLLRRICVAENPKAHLDEIINPVFFRPIGDEQYYLIIVFSQSTKSWFRHPLSKSSVLKGTR
jgi:hypothetical protein